MATVEWHFISGSLVVRYLQEYSYSTADILRDTLDSKGPGKQWNDGWRLGEGEERPSLYNSSIFTSLYLGARYSNNFSTLQQP